MFLDIAKNGKGVEMNVNAAMLAQFRRDDFTGIMPIIINITPITSALPILGMAVNDARVG